MAVSRCWPSSEVTSSRAAHSSRSIAFKPLLLTYFDRKGKYTRDYVEGSAWQWRWAAPYDAAGMIALFNSREPSSTWKTARPKRPAAIARTLP
mgnify:CR=1 FL=1